MVTCVSLERHFSDSQGQDRLRPTQYLEPFLHTISNPVVRSPPGRSATTDGFVRRLNRPLNPAWAQRKAA